LLRISRSTKPFAFFAPRPPNGHRNLRLARSTFTKPDFENHRPIHKARADQQQRFVEGEREPGDSPDYAAAALCKGEFQDGATKATKSTFEIDQAVAPFRLNCDWALKSSSDLQ
jgi:hypothetical protein